MSYVTKTIRQIQVIGTIWMPAITCAQSRDLTDYDLECIGELTRDNIRAWIDTHFGDFQSVEDFRADIADFESDWENEESELTYNDCMFGSEE